MLASCSFQLHVQNFRVNANGWDGRRTCGFMRNLLCKQTMHAYSHMASKQVIGITFTDKLYHAK